MDERFHKYVSLLWIKLAMIAVFKTNFIHVIVAKYSCRVMVVQNEFFFAKELMEETG